MKKKLFVVIIAIALVATIVGTAFAVFVKSDERHASIGYDSSSVTLVIKDGGNELANDFVLTAIQPNQTITQTITLTTNNNIALIQNGAEGEFVATISAATTGDTEKNAALLSHVTFSATDSDSNTYTSVQLAAGVKISLLTIPEYFTLSITLPSEEAGSYDFMDVAEASLALHLEWNRVEFDVDNNAYYLIGTVNGSDETWTPSINAYKLGAGDSDNLAIGVVHLKVGDRFKGYKVNAEEHWASGQNDNTCDGKLSVASNGDVCVLTAGYYRVFVNNSAQLWIENVSVDVVEP